MSIFEFSDVALPLITICVAFFVVMVIGIATSIDKITGRRNVKPEVWKGKPNKDV